MNEHRPNIHALMPPVIKNLLIINGIMLLATYVLQQTGGIDLTEVLGLFYFRSENFRVWQVVTHIFMHGGILHLLSNMFALWMLGATLEQFFGSRKFLEYYLLTGIGAAVLHTLVNYYLASQLIPNIEPRMVQEVMDNGINLLHNNRNYTGDAGKLNLIYNVPTVGASGAVFGVLFAFGWLFPNTKLFIIPIPFPIKAKYFVIGYALFELYSGVAANPGDNIAHFAHIGGMIIGFLLMKIWKVRRPYDYF